MIPVWDLDHRILWRYRRIVKGIVPELRSGIPVGVPGMFGGFTLPTVSPELRLASRDVGQNPTRPSGHVGVVVQLLTGGEVLFEPRVLLSSACSEEGKGH